MEGFWKAAAAVLIAVILGLALGRQELSLLLTLAVSCMVAVVALSYLTPVLDLIRELETIGQLPNQMLEILMKVVAVAMVSELVGKICADAGNSSLCRSIQLLGNAAVLYLSIPIVRALLTLIRDILGEL